MSEALVLTPQNEAPKTPEIKQLRIEMDCATVASELHPGRNDDSYFIDDQTNRICAVFDGISQGGYGQEAAKIAKQIIQQRLGTIKEKEFKPSSSSINNILRTAFFEANQEIINFGEKKSNKPGTTGVCCAIFQDEDENLQMRIANSGDSRAYLFRDGVLTRITQDQNKTWFNFGKDSPKTKSIQDSIDNAINSNQLNSSEQEAYLERDLICNQIGYSSSRPDIYFSDIQPGDIFLFSTDGVHDNLTTQELQSIITQNIPESALNITKKIIDQSVARSEEGSFRSKPDDMTALIVKISG